MHCHNSLSEENKCHKSFAKLLYVAFKVPRRSVVTVENLVPMVHSQLPSNKGVEPRRQFGGEETVNGATDLTVFRPGCPNTVHIM